MINYHREHLIYVLIWIVFKDTLSKDKLKIWCDWFAKVEIYFVM